ncbi:MAG: ribonuclease III [Porticoccus sp.]|nr:ribonuclease III [Porticoccus sp.]MBQ0808039.1 ribonuclease III [Porticoccus sp.]
MQITKQRFLNRIGYQFKDHALLELALTHRSCGSSNNERLEFLGDAALNFIIGHAIYQRLPDIREGELSRYRSSLVKGVTLTDVANELQLSEHLHLGVGEIKSGGHHRASILADTVEAIIGAIYLDGGMAPCEKSVLQWFESRLENLNDQGLKDPKTQLQEFMQSSGSPLPVYEVVGVSGEEHNQQFTVHCRVDGLKKPTIGCGSSRRHAEKQAAELALKGLIK